MAAATTSGMGLTAVSSIAKNYELVAEKDSTLDSAYARQALGTFMRVLMEANGYYKTGLRKSVGHPSFTKAECYDKAA